MNEGFFKRRMVRPLLELLRQGVTPEKLALSVALGAVLGVFPALGTTTALCALAALALRLNLPAIQLVNYFMYPAQIALILPFFRAGEIVFRAPHLPLSLAKLQALIRESIWATVTMLWTTTWHAMVVWCVAAAVAGGLIYVVLVPVFRRVVAKTEAQPAGESPC